MSNTIWLHRIKYQGHVSYPLLENQNFITIGWSDFANPEMVEILQRRDEKAFDETILRGWGTLSKNRWSLWYFAGMKVGDWVVVPQSYSFRVYEVTGELEFTPDNLKKIDLGWQRKVKPLTGWLPREGYADAALATRLKWRGTTIYINDLRASVETAIANATANIPLSVYNAIATDAREKWLEHIRQYNTPAQLERLLAWYFKRVGATLVEKPSGTSTNKIGDCDVEATFESIRTKVCVQVKRHNGTTNEHAVNQIADYCDHADTLEEMEDYRLVRWVVSTADGFTDKAVSLAEQRNVLLLNGGDLVDFLLAAGIDKGIDVTG